MIRAFKVEIEWSDPGSGGGIDPSAQWIHAVLSREIYASREQVVLKPSVTGLWVREVTK